MTNSHLSQQHFVKLIAKLLDSLNYEKIKVNYIFEYFIDHECEIDIIFKESENWSVVEVKSYRPQNPPSVSQLKLAVDTIIEKKGHFKAQNALLILSCELNDTLKTYAKEIAPALEIWDVKDVLRKALPFHDLFQEILLHLEIDSSILVPEYKECTENSKTNSKCESGQYIIEALLGIETGQKMSGAYENVCIQALKHIFNNDLAGWHEQSETIDGLTRRDLVCRVLPNSEVWTLILNDLQSRYVVFEFKNYSNPITQKEVITTEKYLYTTALRRVAFIITQNGHSESAFKVMEGAMREHGKLMLPLTTQDLIDLIHMKDDGSDPNSYIFDVVDKFLIRLGR
ncbi:restriction endonuclease [Thalassotalea euphylliae]|uniref:Uncharacterized protein n=1 Tax=Thalassotalea euphylliae TaxID=1655234 RepID=A0A3E0TJS7_9GAMM|nr:restriction endonuclease [Thalassotalea euphylliae]REL24442.1 hypothetical protein DXX94_19075 [Thalassotalea euphylliae]